MRLKHILLIAILIGLPVSLLVIPAGTSIDLTSVFSSSVNPLNKIIFTSESGSITAYQSDINQVALSMSRRTGEDIVLIEFSKDFGGKLFLFTSKNIGKELTIKTAGIQVGKKLTIDNSYTDRVRITGLNKQEIELLIKKLKE